MASVSEQIHDLRAQKHQLICYCESKLRSGDWHAVQDAASDIREIDAKIEVLEPMCPTG